MEGRITGPLEYLLNWEQRILGVVGDKRALWLGNTGPVFNLGLLLNPFLITFGAEGLKKGGPSRPFGLFGAPFLDL